MQTTQPVVSDGAGRDHSVRTQGRALSAVLSDDRLLEIYELMILGRTLETRLHNMYRGGRLRGAVYPGVGQEAAMVGLVVPLQADDIFGGTHRDLTAQLVKGVPLEAVALNFLGKADGPTKGRDGNSHFGFLDVGSLMVVSPLPDAYPVAVGTALAAKLDGELIGKMKAAGIQVNDADKSAFVAASKGVYEEFAKEVPTGKELIDKSLSLSKGS